MCPVPPLHMEKVSHPFHKHSDFILQTKWDTKLSPKSLESPIFNINYQSGMIHTFGGYREEQYNNKYE